MTDISLRGYTHEIELLIEQGRIDEAIGHCRHILKFFPKHIATYRNLGKAYLEAKQHSDALDIFQRVLSSIPDDFVSHVGMSIIREDEGNLDAAIWHMERAFDVQPSNTAIQDELRRLFGKRDGIEPPKIRLTRSALARMYAHGNLYDQSIGELNAALAESPERLDLQVLLARMQYMKGDYVGAAESCSRLISKIPYCLEANRILIEVLKGTEREDEIETYQKRVNEVDPYTALVTQKTVDVEQIPDSAITLSMLEWDSGQLGLKSQTQPDWAASLGVEVPGSGEEEERIPDWLPAPDEEAQIESSASSGISPFTVRTPSGSSLENGTIEIEETELDADVFEEQDLTDQAEPPEADLVPDWMKEAGWESSDSEGGEITPPAESATEVPPAQEGELTPAEIPDWLQSIAPEQEQEEEEEKPTEFAAPSQEEPAPRASKGSDIPEWLREFGERETSELPQVGDEDAADSEDIPAWLHETGDNLPTEFSLPESGKTEEEHTPAEGGDFPDWLQELEGESPETPTAPETVVAPEAAPLEESTPDWVKDFQEGTEEAAPQQPEAEVEAVASPEIADWFLELENEEPEPPAAPEPVAEEPEPAPKTPDELPNWLQNIEEEKAAKPEGAPPPDDITITSWLKGLSSLKTGEEAAPGQERPVSNVPEWLLETVDSAASELSLKDLVPPPPQEHQEEEAEAKMEAGPALPPQEPPDITEPLPVEKAQEEEPAPQAEGAIPDWLQNFGEEVIDSEGALPEPEEIQPAETEGEAPLKEIPNWLQGYTDELLESEEKLSGEELAESGSGSIDQPEPEPVSEGIEMQMDESEKPESSEEEPEDTGLMPGLEDTESALAWLESLAAKKGVEESELLTSPEERLESPPEWVEEMRQEEAGAGEEPKAEPEPAIELPPEQMPAEEETPAWLEEEPEEALPSLEGKIEELFENIEAEEMAPQVSASFEPEPVEPPVSETTPTVIEEPEPEEPAPAAREVEFFSEEEQLASEEATMIGKTAIPDWLQELPEEPGPQPPQPEEEEAELAEELTAFTTEAPEPVSPEIEAVEDEILDEAATIAWLEDLDSKEEMSPFAEQAGKEKPFPGEELAEEGEKPAAVPEPEAESAPEAEGVQLPEWFSEIEKQPAVEQPAGSETELPEWLRDVDLTPQTETQAEEPAVETPVETPAAAEPELAWTPPAVTEEGKPEQPPAEPVLAETQVREPAPVPESPAAELEKALKIESKVLPGPEDLETLLMTSKEKLAEGDISASLAGYQKLIKKGFHLDEIISDINEALQFRFPVDISVWETLGDAYVRNDQLQAALDAYTKAEELLR